MKLTSRLNIETINKLRDTVFVGRLVRLDDLDGLPIRGSVEFTNDMQEHINFYIKCLSPIPEEIEKSFYFSNKIFTGSTKSNNNIRKLCEWIKNFELMIPYEKRESLLEFLDNKLIVFNLIANSHNDFLFLELTSIEDTPPAEKGYDMIPGPELKVEKTTKDFERRLIEGNRPIVLPKYPNFLDIPEFIYFDDHIYHNLNLLHGANSTTYTQHSQSSKEITKMHFAEKFAELVDARIDDYLYFVNSEKIHDLRNTLNDHGVNIQESLAIGQDSNALAVEKTASSYLDNNHNSMEKSSPKFNSSEIEFLKKLSANALMRGLHYEEKDLYNFHISVKTNFLTIIGGMSGTGKSQLALLYGETLGLRFGQDLKLIPISPSYHEPNDILGFLNPTSGVYYESDTQLVQLLIEAEENPDKLFMVIFDEMNLSQVEHWFSPFISILELDNHEKSLTLFNDKAYAINHNYKSTVSINNNIIFVGTVNFDETTKHFSNRLLDRTNVITPRKLSFLEVKARENNDSEFYTHYVTSTVYRNEWVNSQPTKLSMLSDKELEILDKLHKKINEFDSQKGVSFRIAKAIARYLENIPVKEDGTSIIPRGDALDLQIEQRILTKISGLESAIGSLVGSFQSDGQYKNGELANLLLEEEFLEVSHFTNSIATLKCKAKELMINGFAQ